MSSIAIATEERAPVPLTTPSEGFLEGEKRLAWGISALLLFGFVAVAGLGLSSPFSNDFDEGVYLASARLNMNGYRLFNSIFSSQPPAFIELLSLSLRLMGDSVSAARGLIVLLSVFNAAGVGFLAWGLIRPLAAPVAIAGIVLPSLYFHASRTCQAEVPALAFATIAIALVMRANQTGNNIWVAGAGFLYALGILCKLLVVPLIVPIAFLLIFTRAMSFRGAFRSYLLPRLVVFSVAFLSVCTCCLLRYNLSAVYDQAIRFHLDAKYAFPLDIGSNARNLEAWLFKSPELLLLSVFGLIALFLGNRRVFALLGVWSFSCLLFLLTHSPLWEHHTILLYPPMAIALSGALSLMSKTARSVGLVCICTAMAGFIGLRNCLLRNLPERIPDEEVEVISLIRQHSRDNEFIVTDQQMQAYRAGRSIRPEICDTSYVRIMSGYLRRSEIIRASEGAPIIIFWTHRLELIPGFSNWVRSHYRVLRTFGDKTVFIAKEQG